MGRHPHRGAVDNMAAFAPRFIQARMDGFEKDIRICLTPNDATGDARETCAYFPALAACCAAIEYLTALWTGSMKSMGRTNVEKFATRFLPQPHYDGEAVRVLWDLFRNRVAHHGITSGIWVDRHAHIGGRRLLWSLTRESSLPAIEVHARAGELVLDPPWPCSYTHVAIVRLARLAHDVRESSLGVIAEFGKEPAALVKFTKAMRELYPAAPTTPRSKTTL